MKYLFYKEPPTYKNYDLRKETEANIFMLPPFFALLSLC